MTVFGYSMNSLLKCTFIGLVALMHICSRPLFAMDGNPTRRFTYYGDGTTSSELLLPAARPTPKTKQPTLLFEYFGLPESYARRAAVNVNQIIVEKILNARPIWQQKTTVCHQDVHTIAYSNDGRTVATAGRSYGNDMLCISDREGRILREKKYPEKIGGLIFHPTDESLIVCSSKVFEKIDAQGKTVKTINAGLDPVKCVLNTHKNELAAIDDRGRLKIWSLAGGKPFEKDTQLLTMLDLACHYAGDIFALVRCSYVLLFQRSTDELKHLPHDHGILAVAFEPHGNTLVTGSLNGLLTFWQTNAPERALDVTHWKAAHVIDVNSHNQLNNSCVDRLEFHPRGHLLASLHVQGNKVVLWDLRGNKIASMPACCIPPHCHPPRVALAMHPEDNELAIGYPDMPVVLWQQEKFLTLEQLLFKLILKQYLVKCLAARRKPGYPISYSSDKFIDWMSDWFYVEKEALSKVWRTFSSAKRVAIMRTYIEHAKRVGDIEESIAQCQRTVAFCRKRELEKEQQKHK